MPKKRMGQKVLSFYVSEGVWKSLKGLCANLGINQQNWLESITITSLENSSNNSVEDILIPSDGISKTDLFNFTAELRELADRFERGDIFGHKPGSTTQSNSMSGRFLKKLIKDEVNLSDINLAAAELDIDSEELWNLVNKCSSNERDIVNIIS